MDDKKALAIRKAGQIREVIDEKKELRKLRKEGEQPYYRKAQYHETDQMGIIHHTNYVNWLEEARTDYFEKIGCSYAQLENEGIMSPVVSIQVKYKTPVRYGDVVRIHVAMTKYTGLKLGLHYEILNEVTGEICAEAVSEHCFLDASGKILSLKKARPALDALIRENM